MEPWLSWGIALVVGGLAFYYYNAQNRPQLNRGGRAASISESAQPLSKQVRRREENKAKPKTQTTASTSVDVPRLSVNAGNDVSSVSGAESGKKRKAGKKQPVALPTPQSAAPSRPQREEDDQDDDEDTKAWAQNLLAMKKGTSLAPPTRTDSRNRTVKQSSASRGPTFSATSSNGADADDDSSPALSPALAAGGVSDMLEPTSGGPSILRLTESSKPIKTKQQREQAQFQEAETKKQRQNKKKVEERRIQREAEEKERLVLLEQQRRVARESRGEPARNGLASSKPPAASEWAVRAAARAIGTPVESVSDSSTGGAGLLDTFDQSGTQHAGSNGVRGHNSSLPSEEDQLTLAKKLSQDESGWNTVPKGKKQKKKTQTYSTTESTGSDGGYAPSASFEQTVTPTPAPAPAPAPATKSAPAPSAASRNADAPASTYQSLYSSGYDAGSHPEDSQWSA